MKLYLTAAIILCCVGCANGYVDDSESQSSDDQSNTTYTLLPPKDTDADDSANDYSRAFISYLRPPCKPDKFLADEIPSGYKLDPNCPPEIIWPPRIILKGDPGPVIRYGF